MKAIMIRAGGFAASFPGLAVLMGAVAGGLLLTAGGQQAADPAEQAGRVVVRVGDQRLTIGDIESDRDAAVDYEDGSSGRAELGSVDSGENLPDPAVRAVAHQYVLWLLLATAAIRDGLDHSSGFPVQGTTMERVDWLARTEYHKVRREAVTRSGVADYYASHSREFERAEINTAGIRLAAGGLSPDQARSRASAIRKALETGTGVGQVAAQYNVPGVVLVKSQIVQRGEWPPEMEERVFHLHDGEILQPDDAEETIVLIQMVRHIHPPLAEVSASIEARLRGAGLQKLVDGIEKNTAVWIDGNYFGAGPASGQ